MSLLNAWKELWNITFGINKIQRGRVLKEAVRVNTGSFGTFSG